MDILVYLEANHQQTPAYYVGYFLGILFLIGICLAFWLSFVKKYIEFKDRKLEKDKMKYLKSIGYNVNPNNVMKSDGYIGYLFERLFERK